MKRVDNEAIEFNVSELQEGLRTSLNCLQFVAFVARQIGKPDIEQDAYALHDAMLMQCSFRPEAGQGGKTGARRQ